MAVRSIVGLTVDVLAVSYFPRLDARGRTKAGSGHVLVPVLALRLYTSKYVSIRCCSVFLSSLTCSHSHNDDVGV